MSKFDEESAQCEGIKIFAWTNAWKIEDVINRK